MLYSKVVFLRLVSPALKTAGLLFPPLGIYVTHAAFDLNWARDEGGYVNNDAYTSCDISYISESNCNGSTDLNGSHIDGTGFFQQQYTNGG